MLEGVHGAAGVDERQAVAGEPLHDEPLAAEQADADPPLERDPDRDAAGGAEERILLTDQFAAKLLQIHRQDLAGIGRGKRHLLLARALVGEHRHEQAFTGDQALAGAEQRAHHAGTLLAAAVAEDRLHLDARRHVHHRSRFGDGAFAGIELDLHELHLAAEDAEVHFVRSRHWAPQAGLKTRLYAQS